MDKLELTNTIGQMRDKINEIINSIVGSQTEIKLYNASNPEQYVTITYNGTNVIFTTNDSSPKVSTLTWDS